MPTPLSRDEGKLLGWSLQPPLFPPVALSPPPRQRGEDLSATISRPRPRSTSICSFKPLNLSLWREDFPFHWKNSNWDSLGGRRPLDLIWRWGCGRLISYLEFQLFLGMKSNLKLNLHPQARAVWPGRSCPCSNQPHDTRMFPFQCPPLSLPCTRAPRAWALLLTASPLSKAISLLTSRHLYRREGGIF